MKTVYFICMVVLVSGCVTNKYLYSNLNSTECRKVGILSPIVLIGVIKEGNKVEYDSAFVEKARGNLVMSTKNVLGPNIASKEILVDSVTLHAVYKEIFSISNKLLSAKGNSARKSVLDSYKLSNTIDSLMKVNDVDQLILPFQKGFTRTKSNYRNQNWRGLGTGLLTLGMYIPTPIKANSLLRTWILDSNKKTLVYHNLDLQEVDPLSKNQNEYQVCELYLGLFSMRNQKGECIPKISQ